MRLKFLREEMKQMEIGMLWEKEKMRQVNWEVVGGGVANEIGGECRGRSSER